MYKSIAATTIAALMATTAAFAQVPGGAREGVEKGSPVSPGRDSAPPEKIEKPNTPSVQKGAESEKAPAKEKLKTSEPAAKSGGDSQKEAPRTAEPKPSDKARDSKSSEAKDQPRAADPKTQSSGGKDSNRAASSKDQPARDESRSGTVTGTVKDSAVKDGNGRDGKAASGSSVKPSVTVEQRRQITTVFARHRSEARATVNIDIRVGTRVPRDVKLVAVPQEIVVIVPEYRRFRYFVVGDQVVIVDPASFEIVEILVITA